MTQPRLLARFASLDLWVRPAQFAIGSALIAVLGYALAGALTTLGTGERVLLAALAVVAHWLNDLLHNIGHALAARRSGYPMRGVLFGEKLLFGRSLYPDDEPVLPARVHITRALGGPIFSTLIGLICAALTWAQGEAESVAKWLCAWGALQNLAIFGPGAFVPLDFTDGGTLMRWLPRLRAGG